MNSLQTKYESVYKENEDNKNIVIELKTSNDYYLNKETELNNKLVSTERYLIEEQNHKNKIMHEHDKYKTL